MAQRCCVGFVAALTLVMLGAPCAAVAAQPRQDGAPRRSQAVVASPAAVLARIQALLMALDARADVYDAQAEELAAALLLAGSRSADAPRIQALARDLVAALAPAFVDEDHAERLAQDLYAALGTQRLNPREATLLVEDVTVLLRQMGVASVSGERVLRGLGEICRLAPADGEPPPTAARGHLLLSRP